MFEKAQLVAVTVTAFSGTTTPDKNGKMPVMLQPQAGVIPNRQVMAGTVAERNGFEVGKSYLVNVRKRGFDDEFGEDFVWTKVMEVTDPIDMVRLVKELGFPQVITIQRPEGYGPNTYERKGNAVESLQTKREKEGLYHRTQGSTVTDHSTARKIIEGTSTDPDEGSPDDKSTLQRKVQ